VESTSFTIAEELGLEGNPGLASYAPILLKLDGEHVEDPRQDHVAHPMPGQRQQGGSIDEDVVVDVEGVALKREEHLDAPAGIVGGRRLKDEQGWCCSRGCHC
jgi:hypothetical protein